MKANASTIQLLTLTETIAPLLAVEDVAAPADPEVPVNTVLDGVAPVSDTVPVIATAAVLPANTPAVTVTGKNVMSLGARVVVESPGSFAAEPPKELVQTPAVKSVKVQSTVAVKSCISYIMRISLDCQTDTPTHIPGSSGSYWAPR